MPFNTFTNILGPYCLQYRLPKNIIGHKEQTTKILTDRVNTLMVHALGNFGGFIIFFLLKTAACLANVLKFIILVACQESLDKQCRPLFAILTAILYIQALISDNIHLSQCMRFLTMWYVRPAKLQISLGIRTV